jgi:hypothetical protein
MHRTDNSCFLLFIEPKKKEKRFIPIDDEISKIMKLALMEAKSGTSNYSRIDEIPRFNPNAKYRGFHITDCGYKSEGDYLLENGMITNRLADFYLRFYRKSIPVSEMGKVMELIAFYKKKYQNNPEIYSNIILKKPVKNHDRIMLYKLKRFFEDDVR